VVRALGSRDLLLIEAFYSRFGAATAERVASAILDAASLSGETQLRADCSGVAPDTPLFQLTLGGPSFVVRQAHYERKVIGSF
jgi:hypothetical protein